MFYYNNAVNRPNIPPAARRHQELTVVEKVPRVADYQRLRKAVGWNAMDDQPTRTGLQNSLYSVCLMREGKVIGCGRIVGDAGIYYYIQDIIVLPEFQGRGGGKMIMDAMMKYLRKHAAPNCFVGLMAAKGVSGWYESYGFEERPSDRPGMFMVWK